MPENRGCGCGFSFGDDCCTWIILLIIIFCCCGEIEETDVVSLNLRILLIIKNRLDNIPIGFLF